MVVLLHAPSVLPDLSAALRRGEKAGAVALPRDRLCPGIFRPLPDAVPIPAGRDVDSRWLRDLSFAGVCARHGAGVVVRALDCARGTLSPQWRRAALRRDTISSGAPPLLQRRNLHLR